MSKVTPYIVVRTCLQVSMVAISTTLLLSGCAPEFKDRDYRSSTSAISTDEARRIVRDSVSAPDRVRSKAGVIRVNDVRFRSDGFALLYQDPVSGGYAPPVLSVCYHGAIANPEVVEEWLFILIPMGVMQHWVDVCGFRVTFSSKSREDARRFADALYKLKTQ